MNTILLIEDNAAILDTNKEFLELEGYRVHTASTILEGELILRERHIDKTNRIDLIILDIMLPDGSGVDFCAKIRKEMDIPILFLTCFEDDATLVTGLKAGGDEYMTKPYSLAALSARIGALLRRVRIDKASEKNYNIGPLCVDCGRRRVYLNGEDVLLKPKEFDLLLLLIHNMNKQFTAEELYSLVWNAKTVDVRTVIVHISSLRKKLRLNDEVPLSIVTKQRKFYSLQKD